MAECRPAANLVDLLGIKRQLEQVSDRLLEAGEDQVCPAGGHLPDEQLEARLLADHARGVIAGHHRQLIEISERAQGVRVGPERDGRSWVHGKSPARFGRIKRSSTRASTAPAAAEAGSISRSTGKLKVEGKD